MQTLALKGRGKGKVAKVKLTESETLVRWCSKSVDGRNQPQRSGRAGDESEMNISITSTLQYKPLPLLNDAQAIPTRTNWSSRPWLEGRRSSEVFCSIPGRKGDYNPCLRLPFFLSSYRRWVSSFRSAIPSDIPSPPVWSVVWQDLLALARLRSSPRPTPDYPNQSRPQRPKIAGFVLTRVSMKKGD